MNNAMGDERNALHKGGIGGSCKTILGGFKK
jgi:hypothetical protein